MHMLSLKRKLCPSTWVLLIEILATINLYYHLCLLHAKWRLFCLSRCCKKIHVYTTQRYLLLTFFIDRFSTLVILSSKICPDTSLQASHQGGFRGKIFQSVLPQIGRPRKDLPFPPPSLPGQGWPPARGWEGCGNSISVQLQEPWADENFVRFWSRVPKTTGTVAIWIPNIWIPDSSKYQTVWMSGIQIVKSHGSAVHLNTGHFGP